MIKKHRQEIEYPLSFSAMMNNFWIVAEANRLYSLFMLETMLFRNSVKFF